MLRVECPVDASSFLERAGEFLAAREDEYGAVFGIAQGLARGTRTSADPFFGVVLDGEKVVSVALRTPPKGPGLTHGSPEAQGLLADALFAAYGSLPFVSGPVEAVQAFVARWEALSGFRGEVRHSMRIHRLDVLEDLELAEGQLRLATEGDVDLVLAWLRGFEADTGMPTNADREGLLQGLRRPDPQLHIWEADGVAVSMAAWARPTGRGVSVNAVYTPPELRGHGYATAVVHGLTAHLLASGFRFCVLYTDLANPTSNYIYRKIGYQPVGDTLRVEFLAPE